MKTIDFKTRTEIINQKSPCPEGHWVIGLDTGYSGVKITSPNKIACFPSYARAVVDRVMLKGAEDTDIIFTDKTGEWVIGNLAYDEVQVSDVIDSEAELFSRNRYMSDVFRVTALAGIALGLAGNEFGNANGKHISIQAGLPPKYSHDEGYVKEALSGKHEFTLKIGKGQPQKFSFEIPEEDIYVMPQPLGSLVSVSVDKDGKQVKEASELFKKNLIIFDPGFGTADDYTVHRGAVIGANTFSNLGMKEVFRRTCDKIRKAFGKDISIPELQNYLADGTVRVVNRKEMKSKTYSFENILKNECHNVCHETIEKMKSVHDYFSQCDYIIATGGTYDAWAEEFNDVFKNMEGLRIIPGNINDPSLSNIYSNVRGYYYYRTNKLAPINNKQ